MKMRIILTCIAIFAILGWSSTKANELKDLLADREVEYVGVCHINHKQELVFTKEESAGLQECIVGKNKTDGDNRFVLLWVNNKINRLVKINIKTKAQEVIWRNKEGMV